jgi:hypothetical protein
MTQEWQEGFRVRSRQQMPCHGFSGNRWAAPTTSSRPSPWGTPRRPRAAAGQRWSCLASIRGRCRARRIRWGADDRRHEGHRGRPRCDPLWERTRLPARACHAGRAGLGVQGAMTPSWQSLRPAHHMSRPSQPSVCNPPKGCLAGEAQSAFGPARPAGSPLLSPLGWAMPGGVSFGP